MPPVPVAGCRSGEAGLTWGQGAILRILEMLGEEDHTANLGTWSALPRSTMVSDAVEWIGRLVVGYDALRTRYVTVDGQTHQIVDPAGSLPVEVVELTRPGRDESEQVVERLKATRFDRATEWPVRFAVLTRGGVAVRTAFAWSHMVADAWGMRAFADVLGRLGAPIDPGVQPLDQAAFEASPAGETMNARAAEYWRAHLSAMPATMFPGPSRAPHAGARFWYADFQSPRLAAALPGLARRHGTTTAAVLHSAIAAAMAAHAGTDRCAMGMVAANRARAGTRAALGSYSQLVPVTLPVGGRSWTDLIGGATEAGLLAMRHGAYHPDTWPSVAEAVERDRGESLEVAQWLNDTRLPMPTPDIPVNPAALPPTGTPDWCRHTDRGDSTVYFFVYGTQGRAGLQVMFDTTRISLSEAENLLAGIERGLVDALGRPHRAALATSIGWSTSAARPSRNARPDMEDTDA